MLLLLFVIGAMILPFIGYLVAGLLLAFLVYPFQEGLEGFVSSRVAAFVLVVMTVFAAILPFAIVAATVAEDAVEMVEEVGEEDGPLERLETELQEELGIQVNLRDRFNSFMDGVGSSIAERISQTFSIFTEVTLGLTVLLFTQFYSLKEGEAFLKWTREIDLLSSKTQDRIYSRTAEATNAVLKDHLGVAFIQGILLGVAFAVIGIPNAVFWTFMLMIAGLIPLVGTVLIWAPAAIYLLITGPTFPAVLLMVWSLLATTFTDDVVRPYLVNNEAVHPYLVVTGLIGGITVFGPIGIFLGPVILAVTKTFLEIYKPE